MSGEALLGAPVAPAPPIGTARSSVFTLINSAVGGGLMWQAAAHCH